MAKCGPKVKWTEARIKKLCSKIKEYCREAMLRGPEIIQHKGGVEIIGPRLPSIEECLMKSRFNSKYIYKLANEWEKLGDALEKVREIQKHFLITMTLQGAYKAQGFAIVAMRNNHGWLSSDPLIDQSQHMHYTVQN